METLFETMKSHPLLLSSVGLWLAGITTYATRHLPSRLWSFFKTQLTVHIHIKNTEVVFKRFDTWYESTSYGNKTRTLRVRSVEKNNEEVFHFTPGYGMHFFMWRGRPYVFTKTLDRSTHSDFRPPQEELEIYTFGRSQKHLRTLLESMLNSEGGKVTKLYHWRRSSWEFRGEQTPRDLSSIFMPLSQKDQIVDFIQAFYADKDWYHKLGIPYRTGILLEGPPGTGKTSLTCALCAFFEKPLYIIVPNAHTDESLAEALSSLPDDVIVLIEDIDSYDSSFQRTSDKEKSIVRLSLAGLLNAIDGVSSSKGRLLIMTTNRPEVLDSALIRPGRVDLRMNMGHLNEDVFRDAIKSFYPELDMPKAFEFKSEVSPATLQAWVKQHRSEPLKILAKASVHQTTLQ